MLLRCMVPGALVLALLAPAAAAAPPPPDPTRAGDFRVSLPPFHSTDRDTPVAGAANLGDLDRDGYEDFAVSLDTSDSSSSVWVTLTPARIPERIGAGGAGWRGFVIDISQTSAGAVAGLGDVNGDGLREVVVGDGTTLAVVFGRTDGATVDLANLGAKGFLIRNAGPTSDGGGGHGCCGRYRLHDAAMSVGDQNGDGRDDLAFRRVGGSDVKVVYTPAEPAGAEVDAHNLGDGGFALETGDDDGVAFDRFDDLNDDGRSDVVVAWHDDGNVRAVGVASPGAGETVDLRDATAGGTAFELTAPSYPVEHVLRVDDQNGDGRRDIALATVREWPPGHQVVVGYAPSLGTRRAIDPPVPGESEAWQVHGTGVVDAADQDGDGRLDVAFGDQVRYSSTGEIRAAVGESVRAWTPPGFDASMGAPHYGAYVVGTTADRNGDGQRELVTLISDPYQDDTWRYGPERWASWHLDVFLSAPRPVAESVDPPVPTGDAVTFAATFVTAPRAGTPSLAAVPGVELTRPDGTSTTFEADAPIPAGQRHTRATVTVDASRAGLVHGGTYRYRMVLTNSRGLVGRSEQRTFAFRRPGAGPTLSRVSISRVRLRPGRRTTVLRWRLDRAAHVAVGVERLRRRREPRAVGVVVRQGRAGANRYVFRGRLGRRLLPRGRYRFVVVAVDALGRGSVVRLRGFRILRGR